MNEEATFRGIMHALDDLRRQCQNATNPLVLIFFSGHGACDSDDRHYLVPHDCVQNDLFATALWSRTFESVLGLFNTNRLVVFLDACHAAGIEGDGQKGAQACDPSALLKEPGRYLVASCLKHQSSQERDGHGIFSYELLRLMSCEKESDSKREVVNLRELFEDLQESVKREAANQQEPWSNVQEPGPEIILAINQARRTARKTSENALLKAVEQHFVKVKHERSAVISVDLREFITGPFVADPEPFQQYFRQVAQLWNGAPNAAEVEKTCRQLDGLYTSKTLTAPVRDEPVMAGTRTATARPGPQKQQPALQPAMSSHSPSQSDQYASKTLPAEGPSTPVGSTGSPERRCFPIDDVSYLLENIGKKATKVTDSVRIIQLKRFLMQDGGVSKKEFITFLSSMFNDEDSFWTKVIYDLGARFDLKWENAFKPGAWACSRSDILDLSLIAGRLRQANRPIDEFLADRFSPGAKEALAGYQGDDPDPPLENELVCCLNTIIHALSIWNEKRFDGIELRQQTAHIRAQNLQGRTNLEQLNRMLLEDAYPDGLRKQSVAVLLPLVYGQAREI